MKINLTTIYVDDQDKALRFYTEVAGFVKKADVSQGGYRWLTVASPEEPDGAERLLVGLARAQRQPRGQGLPGGALSAGPARSHVLHGRRPARLRADESRRRRIQDAAHQGDRLDHHPGE